MELPNPITDQKMTVQNQFVRALKCMILIDCVKDIFKIS